MTGTILPLVVVIDPFCIIIVISVIISCFIFRGVYLGTVIYSTEGRILVTMDDNLPIIEVHDSHSSSVGTDYSWLTKVHINKCSNWRTGREHACHSFCHNACTY